MATQTATPTFGHIKVFAFALDPDRAKSVDTERRIVRGLASTPTLDRQGEIVEPSAFTATLAGYLKNPIVTWGHNLWDLPIGKTLEATVTSQGLQVAIQFGTHTRANEVWQAVQDELVRSLSIGFDGEYTPEFGYWDKGAEAWRWTKLDLWEIAVCSVPACPDATFALGKSLGLTTPPDRKTLEAIGQEATGVNVGEPPEDVPATDPEPPAADPPTDPPAVDDTDPHTKQTDRVESDLKRLRGAAEGLSNITRHWAKTGGAPSARLVSEAASSIAVLAEVCKAGRVLSARNREAVETALTAVDNARTALEEVLSRDDESQTSRASADDAADKTAPTAPEAPDPQPAPRGGVRIIAPTARPTIIRISG